MRAVLQFTYVETTLKSFFAAYYIIYIGIRYTMCVRVDVDLGSRLTRGLVYRSLSVVIRLIYLFFRCFSFDISSIYVPRVLFCTRVAAENGRHIHYIVGHSTRHTPVMISCKAYIIEYIYRSYVTLYPRTPDI